MALDLVHSGNSTRMCHTDTRCHYLSELELGNLRACCLPWKW